MSKLMAATLMMAAVASAGGESPFMTRTPNRRRTNWDDNRDYRLSQEQKQRNHQLYGENMTEHEFVIHGEKIMARNKKTAMKIYANRHKKK